MGADPLQRVLGHVLHDEHDAAVAVQCAPELIDALGDLAGRAYRGQNCLEDHGSPSMVGCW
jgi:hypothetical protein